MLMVTKGRIKTIPSVLHIPDLARNLISVKKMSDVGVHIVFKKDRCKMVQRALVLMRGVHCGTLYKLFGSTIIDWCNNCIAPKRENEKEKSLMFLEEILYCGIKD